MNTNQFARTRLTFGKENMEKLYNARVIVFGIGGVGSYVVEALVRSGIGAIDIVDDDKICLSNLNRQLYALQSTIGKDKVDVAEERIHDINPDCKVTKWKTFYMPDIFTFLLLKVTIPGSEDIPNTDIPPSPSAAADSAWYRSDALR